jgi:hypothetical protein
MRRVLIAAAIALGMAACTSTVTVDLTKAQQEAAVVTSALNAAAANYPQAATYVADLNAANAAFQSLPSGTQTGPQFAENVAKAATVLVNAIPQLSASQKASIDLALGAVEAFAAGIATPAV